MSPTFICASAASGACGKKVMKSWYFLCLGFFSLAWAEIPENTSAASATATTFLDNRFIPPHCGDGPSAGLHQCFSHSRKSLACGFASRSQQRTGVSLRLTGAEHGITGYQQVRTCFDDLNDRVVSHSAVYFNSKCQPQFLPQLSESPNLVQRKGNKTLPAEPWIDAHDKNVVDHG